MGFKMFVYQPSFSMWDVKQVNDEYNVPTSGLKIVLHFNNSVLVVEQNNCITKILNAYIAYDVVNWPRKVDNFVLKNCLFGATNTVKNGDKRKYVCSGYGIAFDQTGLRRFGNEFARNVIIFGVDNSSSSLADNCKNDFLVLGETYQ